MAVQAQYGGGMAAGMCLPDHEVEAQMRALQELGAMFSAAGGGCYNGGGGGGGYDCAAVVSGAAQSELTCNNGGGVCGGAVGMGVGAGRKREREVVEQYAAVASSAALLPIPGMMKVAAPVSRLVESGMTSTSGRSAAAVGDALVSELCAQSAEIDAVWSCKSCGEGDATVLLLPCRHLCLCKACEPKLDACPVCLAAKNASVHIAIN
uniref:RING-type domain-containing protein n=1 Tax=Oryza barthii TaxID=65489 RepID=A0A0D3HMT1_9ORYZ